MALKKESEEELKKRIFAAADELWEEGGRSSIPTVAKVRKRARAGQEFASEFMDEWRIEKERALSTPVAEVPEEVRASIDAFGTRVWDAARRCARREFDGERAEVERARAATAAVRAEEAEAFNEQAAELEAANEYVAALRSEILQKDAQVAELREKLAKQSEELLLSRARAEFGESQNTLLRDLLSAEQKRSMNIEAELIEHVSAARKKSGAKRGRKAAEQPEATNPETNAVGLFDDARA